MIITRLKLPLEEIEYAALVKVANEELRSPIDQARFILRQDFERRGLLVSEQNRESAGKAPQGGTNVSG